MIYSVAVNRFTLTTLWLCQVYGNPHMFKILWIQVVEINICKLYKHSQGLWSIHYPPICNYSCKKKLIYKRSPPPYPVSQYVSYNLVLCLGDYLLDFMVSLWSVSGDKGHVIHGYLGFFYYCNFIRTQKTSFDWPIDELSPLLFNKLLSDNLDFFSDFFLFIEWVFLILCDHSISH